MNVYTLNYEVRKVRKIEVFWRMMSLKEKFLSPACFGIVIVCFFFPFLDIKCNEVRLAKVKGIELVTGSEIDGNDFHLPKDAKDESKQFDFTTEPQPIEHNYFAIASFLLAIGGLTLSFLMRMKKEIFIGFIGFAGGLSLLLMRIQIDNTLSASAGEMRQYLLHIDYVYGYWFALIFFFLVGAINLFEYIDEQQSAIRGS